MRLACLALACVFLLNAADDPAFEVASVKPNKSLSGNSGINTTDIRFTTENVNLKQLILRAYDLRDTQLSGGPSWMDSLGWDIAAKAEKELPKGREGDLAMRAMVRSLLTERFQLKFHKETKEQGVYALTVGKNGTKLTPSASQDTGSHVSSSNSKLDEKNTSVSQLTEWLGNHLHKIVIDDTGLTDRYDFTIEFAPERGESDKPDLLVAIQEQLGLKIDSRKSQVDIYVVDSAEKPGEN
jgi:uncharacterized protein (TIGR03435 family)